MRLSTTRLFPLLLMLALAGLTFWLERTVREEEGAHPSQRRHDPDYIVSQRRHDPDYIVEGMNHTRYGAQGLVESTLAAVKMLHYPDDDSTDLLAPRLVQTKASEPRITLTADRGALSQDGDEVFLYGNVLLVRDASAGRAAAQMRTSFLHMVRGQSVILTDRDVVITEDRRVLSGRGMEYHNDSKQLYLRAHVRGRFEPNKDRPSP